MATAKARPAPEKAGEELEVPGIRSFLRTDLTTFAIILLVLAMIVVPVLWYLTGQVEQKTCVSQARTAFLAAQVLAEREAAAGKTDRQIEASLTGADGSENPAPDIARFLGSDTKVRAVVPPTTVENGRLVQLSCTVQGRRLYTVTLTADGEPSVET